MHIPPNSLLFGVNPKILIGCAEKLRYEPESFEIEKFCEALGAPENEAIPVLRQMVAEGFFIPVSGTEQRFTPTEKLNRLALASLSNGISRAEAQELLRLVVAKINYVNSSPEKFSYSVNCLVVFGSYLGSAATIGDLDLGVHLLELPRMRVGRRSIAEIRKSAMSGLNKTFAALRLRQPEKISIHRFEEVISLGTPYRLIWGKLPEKYR